MSPRRHPSHGAVSAPSTADVDAARERPTLPPPFDLENFARQRMDQSEERVAPSDRPTEPAPDEDEHSSASRVRVRRAGAPATTGDPEGDAMRARLSELFFAADYGSALALAEDLVLRDPTDTSSKDFADECRRMLERAYILRLGSLEPVVALSVSLNDLRSLPLDPQDAFLVSRVDGHSTIETLLDVCAMPRLDALRALVRLVDEGILRVV